MVLFSATTSNEPSIHSPFQPPIGPMSLLWICTWLDSIDIPEASSAPSRSLSTMRARPPSKTVMGEPSAVVISLEIISME